MFLLAANAYLLYSLHAKTDRILWEAHQIQNDVNNQLNSMYTQISRQKEQITELKEYVEKSQSLFHETRADMKFRDGKLYVTAEAIPKSQSEGQQVIAGIQAGDRVYEAPLDDDGRAVLEVIHAAYRSAKEGCRVALPWASTADRPVDNWR